MRINLRDIPEGGLRLCGEISEDIFQLGEGDLRPTEPVRYDCQAEVIGDSLLVRGTLETEFELACVRCLEPFRFHVHLPDVMFAEPMDDRATIDLTESVREDILLALPDHPHCEEANPPRNCPAQGLFEAPEDRVERDVDTKPDSRGRWAGLEGFEPGSPEA